MINFIFSLDYEIFGNGSGSLIDHVYLPTLKLNQLFIDYGLRYVNFVEVAEFSKIKQLNSSADITLVEEQIKEMYTNNFEIGLHIHPQWFNATFENNQWQLDYSEYSLANLSQETIDNYFCLGIEYLRSVSGNDFFLPTSFRAGNWLIQPSNKIASSLIKSGIKIDSSVFRGGRQRFHSLDFRDYPNDLYYWKFSSEVLEPNTEGKLIEVPIYSTMVYLWQMYSKKRKNIHLSMRQRKGIKYKLLTKLDNIRLKYPQKLDFTKMTFNELRKTIDNLISIDNKTIEIIKPVVLIGHSKNLFDFDTIKKLLNYIMHKQIPIITFSEFLEQIKNK